MIDSGRNETDRKLEELEKEIHGIYAQANKELQEKMTEYFRKFRKRDEEKRKQLENGEITAEEYQRWRMGQMATGSRWKSMCDVIAKDMHNSNAIARSVTQGHMPEIYAINHNWSTYDIENKAMLNTNYAMYNSDVVENLLKENPDILPLLRDSDGNIVREKDIAWNRKVINAVMLQGILQGESIDKMAKRFEEVGVRNEKAAVRYARTATTGAENAGRIDGYRRAQKLGINVVKVWLATLDGRTRDTHRMLDGEEQEVEKEFSNGCMHPGDPNCPDPSEVWNCRCTLITKVDGQNYDVSKVKRDSKLGDMSYEEWKNNLKAEEIKPEQKVVNSRYCTQKEYNALLKKHSKNVSKQDEKQIKKHKQPDGSPGGYVATHNYAVINSALRGDGYITTGLTADDKKTIEAMRRAISANTLGSDYTLTRYVNANYLTHMFNINDRRDGGTLENNFIYRSKDVQHVMDSLKDIIGNDYHEKAFISTSMIPSKNVVSEGKAICFIFKTPADTNCYIPKNKKESECILGENTRYRVDKISKRIDNIIEITATIL